MHYHTLTPVKWQIKSFGDIAHDMAEPKDYWRHERPIDEVKDDIVWIHEGDLTLDFLNLDLSHEEECPSVLLIQGNLTVYGSIFNQDTDVAVELMVLGNITAEHMAVGGQEIHVIGDLIIHGVFCATYSMNYGALTVKGHMSSFLSMVDDIDEVQVLVEGKTEAVYVYKEKDILLQSEGMPLALEEVLVDEAMGKYKFPYNGLVKLLEEGKSPLRDVTAVIAKKAQELFSYFPDDTISIENIDKLICSTLMTKKATYSFWSKKVEYHVRDVRINEEGKKEDKDVYIADKDSKYFLIAQEEMDEEWTSPIFGSKTNKVTLWVMYQPKSEQDSDWKVLSPRDGRYQEFLSYWRQLLAYVSTAEWYIPRIQPEDVKDFFKLPVIHNLDENDEENNGIWHNNCFYRFYEDGPKIVIQTPDEYNFFYKVVDNKVERLYQPPEKEYEAFSINLDQLGFWERSDKAFWQMKEFLKG